MANVLTIDGGRARSALPLHSTILAGGRTTTVDGPRKFRPAMGLTPMERLELEADAEALRRRLRPATTDEIKAAVLPVFLTMIPKDVGALEEARALGYAVGLRDTPATAIAATVADVLSGEAGLSLRYMPTPAELADLSRKKAAPDRRELAAIVELLEAGEQAPPHERTPEEIARFDAFLARWRGTGPDPAAPKPVAALGHAERVAADLATRKFPPAPSMAGLASETAEAGEA